MFPRNIPEKHTIFLFLSVDSTGSFLAVMAGGVSAAGAMMGLCEGVMAEEKLSEGPGQSKFTAKVLSVFETGEFG